MTLSSLSPGEGAAQDSAARSHYPSEGCHFWKPWPATRERQAAPSYAKCPSYLVVYMQKCPYYVVLYMKSVLII